MIDQIYNSFTFTEEQKKQQIILKNKDNVFYLFLNKKANSFNHDFFRNIYKKVSQVQQHQGPTALVTISLSKLFSGGLDLKYVSELSYQARGWFVLQFISFLGKFSILPFPTIAIVKGAAVAGGCMFAFAHDLIYTDDSASFACNQIDIGLTLPQGMLAVINKKHNSKKSLRDMCLFGKKYKSEQALKEGMIDGILESKVLFGTVKQKAEQLANYGTNKYVMKKIKQNLYKEVVDCCLSSQYGAGIDAQIRSLPFPKM